MIKGKASFAIAPGALSLESSHPERGFCEQRFFVVRPEVVRTAKDPLDEKQKGQIPMQRIVPIPLSR